MGITVETLSRWEQGASVPESGAMLDLALKYLELDQQIANNPQAQSAMRRLAESKSELQKILAGA
ncbi:MAG TPA: hypothetical protein PLD20_10440 [Blastocatellia bacterium]|nr:hypothetical protein [Blastocatellia bacterium]HMV85222.1 hypothetical protein [Blastocatellia bacterium]HMX29440.1 hypothetical protein [Blastocatellia bacterium]HMY75369.1 hypothetical protein [Blastocatellia bacterium]HMZ18337.1 hypothetical protein [Blastocatellia bacterium]